MAVERERARWILVGAVAITVALYLVPYGGYVAYPLVLLSTFAHEMGHGVAAVAVGGAFAAFEMAPDASGMAYLSVPDTRAARAAVAAGGLVGPALLAAAFFSLARRSRTARGGLVAFGAVCLAMAGIVVRGVFGWLVVGALGAGCLYLGIRSTARVAQAVLAFMAVQLSLSVFSRSDYLFMKTTPMGPSDVAQMANALFLPYWFWGILCGGISIIVLFLGLRAFLK